MEERYANMECHSSVKGQGCCGNRAGLGTSEGLRGEWCLQQVSELQACGGFEGPGEGACWCWKGHGRGTRFLRSKLAAQGGYWFRLVSSVPSQGTELPPVPGAGRYVRFCVE